ncbi:MAG: BamA/TamA family outer membrane protein [Bacteroidales bacterium]|nr:BamA/TamA family outer membrane protein [Bacteroidales bacterium]
MKISGLVLVFWFTIVAVFGQINLGDLEELDYANPKKYEIGGVTISGVKYLDNNVLITLSGLTVGDVISIPGEEISKAIRNLWDQGLFENVIVSITSVQGNQVFLNIDLKERPRMSTFSFGGVKKSEADNIRDEIKLASGDVVTDNVLIRTKNIIKDYFTEKGYLDTEVKISQIEDSLRINHVRLQIDIDKKEKVRIQSINIIGNTEFDDQKVKKYLKETKEKGSFNPFENLEGLIFNVVKDIVTLRFTKVVDDTRDYANENIKLRIFKSSKFIKEKYEEDLVNVIDKYNSVGYRDAKILSDSMYRNPDNTVSIDLKLFEGNKYYFRNITWIGNTKYPDAFLNRVLRVEKGDVYNWEMLNSNLTFNQSEDDVSSLYMNDGYLFFQANPVEVLVENDSIDLEIRVYEGKQARINKVSVKGNTRTNDHVVVRELRTRPGQLFSRADIIRTTRELAQLRYFNPETINPNIQPNPADGTVDITYEVEETSSDQIELSGGWGYGRVIGTLGVSFNNFSLSNIFNLKKWRPVPTGDGQKLSLRVQSYGKGYISYSASFTEPWLGGKKPNALSISYYHSLYSNGYPKDNLARQSFTIDGITVGVGRRLTWPDDYFTLYTGVNFQRYKLQNYTQIFSFGNGTGNYNNISLSVILARNSVDQPIYPRNGSLVSVGIEFTPPFSGFSDRDFGSLSDTEKYKNIEYHKWLIQAAYFTPIVGNLVLMARAKFGFLGHYNSQIGNTPFERFYLGGDGLSGSNNLDGREIIGMRGYGNETLTPEYYNQSNQGGTIYSKYTLELRYPLSLNPNATIFVATFLEAGNAWRKFDEFNPFSVYKAAGFGVRVYLPMFGLLGLDWAYGFDPVPGLPDASRGQFHFSINSSID